MTVASDGGSDQEQRARDIIRLLSSDCWRVKRVTKTPPQNALGLRSVASSTLLFQSTGIQRSGTQSVQRDPRVNWKCRGVGERARKALRAAETWRNSKKGS
ncbi:uncharacterized protein CIMG_00188 [Coccidioides immitis RS]|uniref:Uncharacterized protein n=1 Tax=Coccidioides immitis (strain RS) TaxID=246410 RepID=J3KGG6_COCIM|nr:uncharacterized protein CIMG_00188 [Coccidioides immitis RS]EAS34834.3 hypothetical protein CIMG_00188 [Coccidioides immitis RS]